MEENEEIIGYSLDEYSDEEDEEELDILETCKNYAIAIMRDLMQVTMISEDRLEHAIECLSRAERLTTELKTMLSDIYNESTDSFEIGPEGIKLNEPNLNGDEQ